jgi:hypothetical protein
MISIRTGPESRTFYDRKRAEGKNHTQAVLALARRRVNVLWALLREDPHQPRTAQPHAPEPLDAAGPIGDPVAIVLVYPPAIRAGATGVV